MRTRTGSFPGLCAVALSGLLLAGCGVSGPMPSGAGAGVSGKLMGGQQPISGATIALYQAGAAGTGTGATDLLPGTTVTTDANGNFTLPGGYPCTSSSAQVYVVSRGGNPGLPGGGVNPAAVLMAPLGSCGPIPGLSFVTVNEVTTAASVWALAQFMTAGGQAGASSTNATGIANAFALARSLVSLRTGTAPGENLPAGATAETTKLYTLADALAGCINSSGGSACGPLFAAATVNGTAPGNTLDAALNIVKHPGSNVEQVYAAVPAQGPFQPTLTAAPNDWTMSVTYTGGGLASPTALALDSTGSVWVANYFGSVATKLSATGAAQSFADPALNESYGLTVDGNGGVWIANEESSYTVNSGGGSLTHFSSSGQLLSGTGIAGGGLDFPYAVAAAANGTLWVADHGGSTQASLFDLSGASLAGAGGYTSAALPLPVAVAVDGQGNGWFAALNSAVKVTPAGVATGFACCASAAGIALDPTGNVWVTEYSNSALDELSAAGVSLQHIAGVGGLSYPGGVAADSAGTLWVANRYGNSLTGIAPSAFGPVGGGGSGYTVLSPGAGFGVDAGLNQPYGIAVDGAGDVWVSNFGGSSVTEFLGVAAPVKTPLLGLPGAP